MPVAATLTAPTDADSISATGIELFRAGSQRDSLGREQQWTAQQLDEMAAAYNEIVGHHDAPVLVGHDGETSYGWLSRAYRDGDKLKGDFKEVDPAFAEAVNAGRYKKRSISIYPPTHPDNPTPGRFNIRHLAYVGIPAVKGLKDHKFSDSADGTTIYDFGEGTADFGAWNPIAMILRGLREQTIADKDIETADRLYPAELLSAIESTNDSMQSAIDSLWSRIDQLTVQLYNPTTNMSEQPTATAEDLQAQLDQLKSERDAALTDRDAAIADKNKLAQTQEHSEVKSFVEGMVRDRKLPEARKETVIKLALGMDNTPAAEFGEGAENLSVRWAYLKDLEASSKQLYSVADMPTDPKDAPTASFSERSKLDSLIDFDPESEKADQKIRAYMAEHSCSYGEATDALQIYF